MATNGKYGIGITLRARQQVSGPVAAAKRSIHSLGGNVVKSAERMRTSMERANIGVRLFTGSLRLLKGAFGLAKDAAGIEQEMVLAQQAAIGESRVALVRYAKVAKDIGLDTQFSTLQSAQALRQLIQTGRRGADNLRNVLGPAAALATASMGKLGLVSSVKLADSALSAFRQKAKSTKNVFDILLHATNSFKLQIEELPMAINKLSRGSSAFRMTATDAAMTLGMIKLVGGSIASNARLASRSMLMLMRGNVQKKLKSALGVDVLDSMGKYKSFPMIINNIGKSMEKWTQGKQGAFISQLLGAQAVDPVLKIIESLRKKGIRGMDGITRFGANAIKFYRKESLAAQGSVKELLALNAPKALLDHARKMRAAGGQLNRASKAQMATFAGQLNVLGGRWKGLKETIGSGLSKVFQPFVTRLSKGLRRVVGWIDKLSPSLRRAASVGVVMGGILLAIIGGLFALKLALVTVIPLAWALFGPFIIAGLKAAAVAGLLALIWNKNFGNIQGIVSQMWAGFKEGWRTSIMPLIDDVLPDLKIVFLQAWVAIKSILKAFGLQSEGTTKRAGGKWFEFGNLVGMVAGFVVRAIGSIIFVIAKAISLFAQLLGWVAKGGRRFTNWVGLTDPASPSISQASGKLSKGKAGNPLSPGGPTTAGVPPAVPNQLAGQLAALRQAFQQQSQAKQPIHVTTKLDVDGRQVASATKEVTAADKGRGFRRSGQGG